MVPRVCVPSPTPGISELRRGKVRIIALTGFGQERDRLRAREAGCDEHLVKPDPEVLRGVRQR